MRIEPQAALGHGLRRQIVAQLAASPGMTVNALAALFDVDYKTAQHHVRVLARSGHLVTLRAGRAGLCYLPDRVDPPAPRLDAAARAVESGARTPARLARALGVPRGTAGDLLAALKAREQRS